MTDEMKTFFKPRQIALLRSGLVMLILFAYGCKKDNVYVTDKLTTISILQTFKNNDQYKTFLYGLERTGLDKLLDSGADYTVLAPTDGAFNISGIVRFSQIDSMNLDSLKHLLAYHILPGRVYYSDVPSTINTPYKTIDGSTVYFSKPSFPSQLFHVNGDTIVQPDILASNGVIQVVSHLLKNPKGSIKDFLMSKPNYRLFDSALSKFGLLSQLAGPGLFTVFPVPDTAFRSLGITLDSISVYASNISGYSRSLFDAYIDYNNRLFTTDFVDLGFSDIGFNMNATSIYPNSIQVSAGIYIPNGQGNAGLMISANSLSRRGILGPLLGDVAYSNGDYDQVANNGVIQGVDHLIVYPFNAKR